MIWLKSDYIDPPDTGGRIRTYNLLRQMRSLCDVKYVSLRDMPKGTMAEIAVQPPVPWAAEVLTVDWQEQKKTGLAFYGDVLRRMASSQPYIVQKYLCPTFQQWQRDAAQQPDAAETVLVCDFLEMSGNVDWSTPFPKVLFQHNVESNIWKGYFEHETNPARKAYFWFEYQRMRKYEARICNRFDLVLVVSERDRQSLAHDLGVTTPIEVIETGVDPDFFAEGRTNPGVPGKLVFLGSLDWMPNIDGLTWFMRSVYPLIKQQRPEVTLDIVGRRPTPAVQQLVANEPSATIFGSVPDVRPHVAEADLFIVPLRIGSGTRLKIYEGMAMERAVVSTTLGAEGLPLVSDVHIVRADTAEGFAGSVVDLLAHPAKKQQLARTGCEFVTTNYSWQSIARQFCHVCEQLLMRQPRRAELVER